MTGKSNIYKNTYITDFLYFNSITIKKIRELRRKKSACGDHSGNTYIRAWIVRLFPADAGFDCSKS